MLGADLEPWRRDLQERLERVQQHPEQGLGFIEEQVRQCTLELQRKLVQRAMQAKADAVSERSYVATRQGIEPLTKQLHYETMARGLGQAQ